MCFIKMFVDLCQLFADIHIRVRATIAAEKKVILLRYFVIEVSATGQE
jgi:hypothetical protein